MTIRQEIPPGIPLRLRLKREKCILTGEKNVPLLSLRR